MSKYLLYGDQIIKNDDSLHSFCKCLFENAPFENNEKSNKEDILELIWDQLDHDLPITDIDYEKLLKRYASDIGPVLYEMQRQTKEVPKINFFGPDAAAFFNIIAYKYVEYHLLWVTEEKKGFWELEPDRLPNSC